MDDPVILRLQLIASVFIETSKRIQRELAEANREIDEAMARLAAKPIKLRPIKSVDDDCA